MRNLNRNKRVIHYALYMGDEPIYDAYSNETGERKPIYSEIKKLSCNISAASGEEAVQAFGSFTNYSRIACVSDNDCPIAEHTIVWFGAATTGPHNYIVTAKADSKNGILYALLEVKVRT